MPLKQRSKPLAVTTLPNDSPAIKDASFYVKSILKVTVFMLQSRAYIIVSLIVHKYMYVRQQTYDSITNEKTTTPPRMYLFYK